jgi:hypothetical protein
MADEVTKEQFHRYVRLQYQGRFNMNHPDVETVAGLSSDVIKKIMCDYEDLLEKYGVPDE